jgi:hypothetical protein
MVRDNHNYYYSTDIKKPGIMLGFLFHAANEIERSIIKQAQKMIKKH